MHLCSPHNVKVSKETMVVPKVFNADTPRTTFRKEINSEKKSTSCTLQLDDTRLCPETSLSSCRHPPATRGFPPSSVLPRPVEGASNLVRHDRKHHAVNVIFDLAVSSQTGQVDFLRIKNRQHLPRLHGVLYPGQVFTQGLNGTKLRW